MKTKKSKTKSNKCECQFCKDQLEFNMPQHIIDATINRDLVIFAGAGISTETNRIFPHSFYEYLYSELPNQPDRGLDFPSLMSLYCSSFKNGRKKLLKKIKERFDYCHQYSQLYRIASRFHEELSSNFYLNTIITTNWDDFFERECAAVPFIDAEDFAFFDLPDRKVYKIHGSISNYGSIIATNEDYKKCYQNLRKGVIGASVKTLLATKTVVFIGYSLQDFDFVKIFKYLKKELNDIIPHYYFVSPIEDKLPKVAGKNFTFLKTDGTYFLSVIRKHLEGCKRLIPKENLDAVQLAWSLLNEIHKDTINERQYQPNQVYCAFYQDGMQHAFSFLDYHAKSGFTFYPPKILNSIKAYERLRKKCVSTRNYADIAYIDGYYKGIEVIFSKWTDLKKNFPFWYIYGLGPVEKNEYYKCIKNKRVYHAGAEKYGKKAFRQVFSTNLVMHHTPFLPQVVLNENGYF